LKDSPYRVVIYGSGGWSHGFLTEKNDFLWPDRETDMVRLRQVDEGREEEWKTMTLAEVEDSGQQELLNGVCVAGAMNELKQKSEVLEYLETYIFNSGKCLAVYRPQHRDYLELVGCETTPHLNPPLQGGRLGWG